MKKIILLTILLNGLAAHSQDTIKRVVENNACFKTCISNKLHYTSFTDLSIFVSSYDSLSKPLLFKMPRYSYMATYNRITNTYDYYPSEIEINFNINSPRIANQRFSPLKVDSFNPHGVKNPQTAVPLGFFNLLLKELQK